MPNVQGSGWIRKETRLAIYLHWGMHCGWCGANLVEVGASLDHIRGRTHRRGNDPSNLVASCPDCNHRGPGYGTGNAAAISAKTGENADWMLRRVKAHAALGLSPYLRRLAGQIVKERPEWYLELKRRSDPKTWKKAEEDGT